MLITEAAFKITEEERNKTIKRLMESSYPGSDFFIMLLASTVIAVIGLILDNPSVIVGSMLVAPFLSSVLSISLGVVFADFALLRRSLFIAFKSAVVAIAAAALFAVFISVPEGYNAEILSRVSPSLPYLYVAIAAGIAASFALVKPNLAEFLVGVAVSVSILPPLAVTGIGLASLDGAVALGSFQLFIVNLLGIIFAGVVVFSLMGFYPLRDKVGKAMKTEENKLEKEQNHNEGK